MTEPARDRPKRTWPIDERPFVWVTTNDGRFPGREHGYREHGRRRLVEWRTPNDLTYITEVAAHQVEHRPHPDTEPD